MMAGSEGSNGTISAISHQLQPQLCRVHEKWAPQHGAGGELVFAGIAVRIGGGYGDAHARDPERVLEDVKRGYYSPHESESLFAVVVTGDPLEIDADATALLRGSKAAE